jgi:hypothetical protein
MIEQIQAFINWMIANLPHIGLAVITILGGLGMVIEGLMLLVPTEDKKSALEKILKKLQYLGELVSKVTSKLPSNVKPPKSGQ